MTLSRETELAILYEISALPLRLSDIDAILKVALDKITRLFGAEAAIFYFQDGGALHARAAVGIRLSKALPRLPAAGPAAPGRHTALWRPGEPWPFAGDPLQGRYPAEAVAGIPVRSGADLLGWIYAARFKPNPFNQSEASLFNILAEHIAGALAIAIARGRDQQHQAVLEASNRRLEAMLAEITQANQHKDTLMQTIEELSTPVLRIADRIVLLPLIGGVDHQRLGRVTAQLLETITACQARVCIIDVTGVPEIDTHVAGGLVQLASSARLLGSGVILCGIAPDVAQIVVSLGLTLDVMIPASDLQGALVLAFRLEGLRVVKS